MKQRNPLAVLLLSFFTLGIYSIYWLVKTKAEMNRQGAQIPTAWLLIVPLINIWWYWKYSEGVGQVTAGRLHGVLAFLLLILLGAIGAAIIQDYFNKPEATPVVAAAPVMPPAPASPTPTNPSDTTPGQPTQPTVS